MNKCIWNIITQKRFEFVIPWDSISAAIFCKIEVENRVCDSAFWNLVTALPHFPWTKSQSFWVLWRAVCLSWSSLLAIRWSMGMNIFHTALGALPADKWLLIWTAHFSPCRSALLGPTTFTFYRALAWGKWFPYRRACAFWFQKMHTGQPNGFLLWLSFQESFSQIYSVNVEHGDAWK